MHKHLFHVTGCVCTGDDMAGQQGGSCVGQVMLLQVILLLVTVYVPCLSLPLPSTASRRALQQAGREEKITIAVTSRGLLQAVESGAAHIEIQNHINVSGIPTSARRADTRIFGDLPPSVRSIRVCDTLPSTWSTTHSDTAVVSACLCSTAVICVRMQGNCSGVPLPTFPRVLPSHAPLAPLVRDQCLVVTDQDMWQVNNTQVWMDSLYMCIAGNVLGSDLLSQ